MRLTPEQLNQIFNAYLKEHILLQVENPHPVFNTLAGGSALTRRLLICLKDKRFAYIYWKNKIDCEELIRKVMPYLKKGVTLVGLGYTVTEKDIPLLIQIHNRMF